MRAVASLSATKTNPEGKTTMDICSRSCLWQNPTRPCDWPPLTAASPLLSLAGCRYVRGTAVLSSQDEPGKFQLGGTFGSGLWSRPHFADKDTAAGGGLEALRPWMWQKEDQGLQVPHPILFL